MTAAAVLPEVERLRGRPLRESELIVDVVAMTVALDTAKDELERLIADERLRAVRAWLAGDRFRLRVTDAMVDVLAGLLRDGATMAAAELERLGVRALATPEELDRLALTGVTQRLGSKMAALETKIVAEGLQADLGTSSLAAIERALERVLGSRDVAAAVVSGAMFSGMGKTFEDASDLIDCWEYSSVLDGGTCSVCRPLDGRRFYSLDELFAVLPNFGPNPRCQGGPRCRCRAVPCEPGTATPPPDTEPDEPPPVVLPPWAAARGLEARLAGRTLDDAFAIPGNVSSADLVKSGLALADDVAGTNLRPGAQFRRDLELVDELGAAVDSEVTRRIAERGAAVEERIRAVIVERDRLTAEHQALKNAMDVREDQVIRAKAAEALGGTDAVETVIAKLTQRREGAWAEQRGRLTPAEFERMRRDQIHRELTNEIASAELLEAEVAAGGQFNVAQAADIDLKVKRRLKFAVDDDPEFRRVRNEVLEMTPRVTDAIGKVDDARAATIELARDAARDVIGEFRAATGRTGGFGEGSVTVGRGARAAGGKLKTAIDAASRFYPDEWLAAMRAAIPKLELVERQRGYFSRWNERIALSGRRDSRVASDPNMFGVAVHELGHFAETGLRRLRVAEWTYYHRRTRGGDFDAPQDAKKRIPGYSRDEQWREDKWVQSYTGKDYGNGPLHDYEVFTMLMQEMSGARLGKNGSDFFDDVESRRWLYGVLALL